VAALFYRATDDLPDDRGERGLDGDGVPGDHVISSYGYANAFFA
jgi:hypothetical protein